MSDLGERFIEFRDYLGMSQSALARKLDVAQSTLSQIEQGKSLPGAELLRKLIDRYDISSDWLLTGRGNRGYTSPTFSSSKKRGSIPLVNAAARAGYIDSERGDDFISTLDCFRIPGIDNTRGSCIFEIEGDSMMPTFYPGDYVVCSPIEEPYRVDSEMLGVVLSKEGLFIKRIKEFDGRDGRAIILQSDNTNYRPIMIGVEEVKELWCVELRMTSAFDYVLLLDHQRFSKLESELEILRRQFGKLRSEASRGAIEEE